jgi:hypothetical protein
VKEIMDLENSIARMHDVVAEVERVSRRFW